MSQCMGSYKLPVEYTGAVRVQKREEGIAMIYDCLRRIYQRG